MVVDTGLEPVTSSMSRKRANQLRQSTKSVEVETGFEPVYAALQATASPLGHSTVVTGASGRRDSNPRPSPWQGDALPAEPRPRSQELILNLKKTSRNWVNVQSRVGFTE